MARNNPLHAIGSDPSSQIIRLMILWRPAICRRRKLCSIVLLTRRRKFPSPKRGRSSSSLIIWTGGFHHPAQNSSGTSCTSLTSVLRTSVPIPCLTFAISKCSVNYILEKNPTYYSSESYFTRTARTSVPMDKVWNLAVSQSNVERRHFFLCRCQNRRILGRGSRSVRLGWW